MLIALAALAMASGTADIELLPPLASEVVPGVPETASHIRGMVRANVGLQYQLDPLVASEEGDEFGAVVHHRVGGFVAVQFTPAKRVAFDVAIPLAAQFGNQVGYLSGDGVGLQDPVFGVSFGLQQSEGSDLGLRVALSAPLGADEMWLGDAGVRGTVALNGRIGTKVVAGWALGANIRDASNQDEFLALGTEFWLNAGVRIPVGAVEPLLFVAGRTALRGVVDGSPTFTIEPGIGARYNLTKQLALQGTVGRGVTKGYGAGDFRGRVTLTLRKAPPDELPPVVQVIEIEEPPDELVIQFQPEPEPLPPVAPPRVEIPQQVVFGINDDLIPPAMLVKIDEVAVTMLINKTVDHVVIEGRASDEASFEYNYALSERRARAVFEALVKKGIHPDRLSYRAMGEVRAGGVADPQDRIVTFEVTRYADTPAERAPVATPWNGARE